MWVDTISVVDTISAVHRIYVHPKAVCASLRKHGSFQMDMYRAIGPVLLSIQEPFFIDIFFYVINVHNIFFNVIKMMLILLMCILNRQSDVV